MRLLVDAQLPPALAEWFATHGLPATPVRELGLRDSDDGSIWNFACEHEWVLVTKDEDFVARCLTTSAAPTVIWIRRGNCTNRALFSWLEGLMSDLKERLEAGDKIIELT